MKNEYNMKIICEELFNQAVEHAEKTNDPSLQFCLDRFRCWENNPNAKCEIIIYADFAPFSFGFTQVYQNGNTGIIGGLLYHGNPDESFAVQITPKIGWQIHT